MNFLVHRKACAALKLPSRPTARPTLSRQTVRPRPARQSALMRWTLAWLGLVVLLMSATLARASALPGEVPALAGRLSTLAGDVRWFDRDSNAWVQSSEAQPLRNWPLAPGDRLRTGAGGRAELRIGSTTVRLGADAELWLPRLDEQAVLLHLQAGSMAVRLAEIDRDSFGPVEMLTREGRWLPQGSGHFRLDRERDATQASSWRGELRFEGRDSALSIGAGRRADLWQDSGGTTRFAWAGVERDGFASWVAHDERQDDAPISARYVPPGMTGWQDLDRHGDWIDDQQHGMVWQPRVVAQGWVPFHDGRWAWVAPWGWTWIDAAPWGFAPFHYGAWVSIGGRWSWSPGARHERPRYAPAHSGWVGAPQVGISIQIGGRPPPPRVVVPVVVVRQAPAPRPIIVMPREPDGRDQRGGRDGRDGREPDGRRDDRRGDERRADEGRADDRRGEPRRIESPRSEAPRRDDGRRDDNRRDDPRGSDSRGVDNRGGDTRGDNRGVDTRRDDRRSDIGAVEAPRVAGPERPTRQAPMIEAPGARAAAAPQPAQQAVQPPVQQVVQQPAQQAVQQPAQPRAAEPRAAEQPRRGQARDGSEAREARGGRADRADPNGRRGGDDQRRERE